MCGGVSNVKDPADSSFFFSFALFYTCCPIFPVHWLSLCFPLLFFIRARLTDNSCKEKNRLSHLFHLDLCTGAAGTLSAETEEFQSAPHAM